MVDRDKLFTVNFRIADLLQTLNAEERDILVRGLVAQEICTHPIAERASVLADVIAEQPSIVRVSEEGMRLALVQNAKEGL